MKPEDPLATLRDERDIHRTLCRFAEAMDRREWKLLDDVLDEQAGGDFGRGHMVKGRHEFVALFQKFLGGCGPTQHLLGNLVVDVTGDRAESRCYVRDVHQGAGDRAHLTFYSPGLYHDCWLRLPEGWRIIHRTKINFMMIGSIEALGAAA